MGTKYQKSDSVVWNSSQQFTVHTVSPFTSPDHSPPQVPAMYVTSRTTIQTIFNF